MSQVINTWPACSHKCFDVEAFGSYALTMCLVRLLSIHATLLWYTLCLTQHSTGVHQFHVVLHLSHATGIGLTLNNVQYTNNSVVNITDIGTGSAALLCTTTYVPCCFSVPRPGNHWYFPNGTRVSITNTLPYYRTRMGNPEPGTVLLHRNSGATTTGIFRCDILDASGIFQSIYVGIYTATTGESCTLKRNTFV